MEAERERLRRRSVSVRDVHCEVSAAGDRAGFFKTCTSLLKPQVPNVMSPGENVNSDFLRGNRRVESPRGRAERFFLLV